MSHASSPLRIILRPTNDPARQRHFGPYRIEALIDEEEEGAVTAYRVAIAPHQQTAVSLHRRAEELYYVLSGRGVAVLDGVTHAIAAGDFLRLPPGTAHGFVTDDEPLEMLNIHTPGCRPDRDVYFPDGPPPAGFTQS